jgi:hypothetical protein
MSDRFCPQCNAEVEDAGGFCLLGHSLRSVAPVASLKDLRAEVDRAFEDARVQVAHALGDPPPPPPITTRSGLDLMEAEAPTRAEAPTHTEAPTRTHAPTSTVYAAIDQTPSKGPDPISEFAPAPRMDWGPERRQGLLKRFD